MAALLRVTCRPIRAMRAGTMRDVYSVHPVSGEGAHQHNTRKVPFGPVVPVELPAAGGAARETGRPAGNGGNPPETAAARGECASLVDALAAAVADPGDPTTETGDAYADRQTAAYGVEPARWTTDTLLDAHAHLVAAGTYPDHLTAIGAELVARGLPDALVLVVCAEMERRRQEWRRRWNLTPVDGPDTDADRAFNAYGRAVWPHCSDLVAQLVELRAITPAGVRAKAGAALAIRENGHHDGPDSEHDLATSALRDAALLVVA